MRSTSPLATALALLAVTLAAPPVARAQSAACGGVVGSWSAEEPYFRATILIERSTTGELEAFFAGDDLSRGARFSEAAVRGDSVFLAADHVGASFRGAFSEIGPTIRGKWTQGEATVPLTLTPVEAAAARPRPQEPTPPFPYSSEEVAFESATGTALAGTLTTPVGEGPFPGVVLLQGSGLSDRDAEVGGHRTFAVLADHLTRSGIAVLRYDKRGSAGLDDLTRDAEAALRYLRARPEVDPHRTGLVGHSEGALVAPRAVGPAGGAFLVLLAPPVALIGGALVEQNARLAAASEAPSSYVEGVRALMGQVVAAAQSEADSASVASEIRSAFAEHGLSGEALEASVRAHTSQQFRDLARYDPGLALRDVRVPVLAVVGSLDLFTPPGEIEAPLREALAELVTVRVVQGVNHWLQPAVTGLPDEIERTDTTVSPVILDMLTDWIHEGTMSGR